MSQASTCCATAWLSARLVGMVPLGPRLRPADGEDILALGEIHATIADAGDDQIGLQVARREFDLAGPDRDLARP